MLFFGILFMPYIFAWFLLRGGYSTRSRIIGLSWAALIMMTVVPRAIYLSGNLAASPSGSTNLVSQKQVRHDGDAVLLATGERMVNKMLKDPDSAVFRNSYGWIKHGQRVACGEVNSKNSFGAMSGFAHWVVLYELRMAYLETSENRGSFAAKWNRYCAGDEDPVDPETNPSRIALGIIQKADLPCPAVRSSQADKDGSIHAYCSNGEDYMVKSNGGIYLPYRCSVSRKHDLGLC